MVMTLRRHNPPHLDPAIVWYLWLMISTNRFVIFLWDEYEWMRAWEEGCDLFCFHFVLSSNQRSVSDRDASARYRWSRVSSGWMDFRLRLKVRLRWELGWTQWRWVWAAGVWCLWWFHLSFRCRVISVCHTAARLVEITSADSETRWVKCNCLCLCIISSILSIFVKISISVICQVIKFDALTNKISFGEFVDCYRTCRIE